MLSISLSLFNAAITIFTGDYLRHQAIEDARAGDIAGSIEKYRRSLAYYPNGETYDEIGDN